MADLRVGQSVCIMYTAYTSWGPWGHSHRRMWLFFKVGRALPGGSGMGAFAGTPPGRMGVPLDPFGTRRRKLFFEKFLTFPLFDPQSWSPSPPSPRRYPRSRVDGFRLEPPLFRGFGKSLMWICAQKSLATCILVPQMEDHIIWAVSRIRVNPKVRRFYWDSNGMYIPPVNRIMVISLYAKKRHSVVEGWRPGPRGHPNLNCFGLVLCLIICQIPPRFSLYPGMGHDCKRDTPSLPSLLLFS